MTVTVVTDKKKGGIKKTPLILYKQYIYIIYIINKKDNKKEKTYPSKNQLSQLLLSQKGKIKSLIILLKCNKTMKYDIIKNKAPEMPILGIGTESIQFLLSQASKDMHEPLVPMLFPFLGA